MRGPLIKDSPGAITQSYKIPENCFFIACYDPIEKEIFFSEFITEHIIKLNNFKLQGAGT